MSPRASALSPAERRLSILDAAIPLLREHGRATTTKQIAEAAGIAEGTVFRVFATKEEVIQAALDRAFDPQAFLDDLAGVDAALPLRERMVALVTLLQDRFIEIFALMTALAVPKPPARNGHEEHLEWRRRGLELMVALLEPDRDAFATDLPHVVKVLRLLTFSGSHPHITDQSLLTPDEIVDVVLHGTLRKDH
jgi:AcrR family transcriptional regulator